VRRRLPCVIGRRAGPREGVLRPCPSPPLRELHLAIIATTLFDSIHDVAFFPNGIREPMCRVGLLQSQYTAYPFKTFMPLIDPGVAVEITADCVSMKDEWTRDYEQKYGADLCSKATLSELTAYALIIDVDTSIIEARHASMRRYLHVRGTQTHKCTVVDMSSNFVAGVSRVRAAAEKRLQQTSCSEAERRSGGAGGRRNRKVAEPPPKRFRRSTPSGGAWRAFVHERTRGRMGRPDFSKLSDDYRMLTEEERDVFARVGRLATAAHRAGSSQAFGRNPLSIQIQRRRDRLFVLARRLQQASLTAAHVDPEQLSELVVRSSRPSGSSAIDACRQLELARARVSRVSDHLRARVLDMALVDPAMVTRVVSDTPALCHVNVPRGLHPMLHAGSDVSAVEWCDWPRLAWTCARVIATGHQNSPTSKTLQALQRGSLLAHRVIMHDECPPITATATRKTRCMKLGTCICRDRERGRLIHNFLRTIPSMCPRDSPVRQLLSEGNIVMRIAQHAQPDGAEETSTWFHVGWIRFSPFATALQPLHAITEPAQHAEVARRLHCYLCRATGEAVTPVVAMASMDLSKTCTIELYEVLSAPVPLGAFDPDVVFVRRLRDTAREFWTPRARCWRMQKLQPSWAAIVDARDDSQTDNEGTSSSDEEASSVRMCSRLVFQFLEYTYCCCSSILMFYYPANVTRCKTGDWKGRRVAPMLCSLSRISYTML